MNVRTLCLSVLYNGEATGYDIRRMASEGEFAYFVEASFGSIYPALTKLEEDGLVTSRTVPQTGKPARKVYSITEAGRESFVEELSRPIGEDTFCSPFLMLARFASILPENLVAQRAEEHLEQIKRDRQRVERGSAQKSMNAADCWVTNYSRSVLDVAEKYLRTHMNDLIRLSRAEKRKDAAE